MPDRLMNERRFSVFTLGDARPAPPPVLGTFMMHDLSMKKKLLPRSESVLNQQGSPWPHVAEMNQSKEATTLGKSIGISAPNWTTGGNQSPSGALSVIAEASDKDWRHFKKHRKQLIETVATDETLSNHDSAQSLDQVMDKLQLEAHDQSITPKPYRDPTTAKYRKRDEAVASKAERMSLSPKDALEKRERG
ncbi:hypothetical protein CAEBREN_07833 [Caenorhabditis brenneri]|uniref:Uncharacterized protein n=1 Tax=Caenorhabditis brenneri TaxID=135651 RepID=G0NYT3_CAEBE|nr:hypothetical protein CAEBREN_07833 [Caenorhabditis brenneri]